MRFRFLAFFVATAVLAAGLSAFIIPQRAEAAGSLTFDAGFTEFVWDRTSADIDTALSPISGQVIAVFHWNNGSQSWTSYLAAAPSFINSLTRLDNSAIYWLLASARVTLPDDGTMLPTSGAGDAITFRTGFTEFAWNRPSADIGAALASLDNVFVALFQWNSRSQTWTSYTALAPDFINSLRTLQTSGIYWIVTIAGATLPGGSTTSPPPDDDDGGSGVPGGAILGSGGHPIPPELLFPGGPGIWDSVDTSEGVLFSTVFNGPVDTIEEILAFYQSAFTALGAPTVTNRIVTPLSGELAMSGPGGRGTVEVFGSSNSTKSIGATFVQFN